MLSADFEIIYDLPSQGEALIQNDANSQIVVTQKPVMMVLFQ